MTFMAFKLLSWAGKMVQWVKQSLGDLSVILRFHVGGETLPCQVSSSLHPSPLCCVWSGAY